MIRYQDTEIVVCKWQYVCKWHCQYEVDDNECEYITDCEWLVSEVIMMLRGWVQFSLNSGAWWPGGRSSSWVSQFLPSGCGSAYQMAAEWIGSFRGDLSPWWFWQLYFGSVWGRCTAERGEQDPEIRSAKRTTLCKALQSWLELFPYHTEIHWVNTLSMVPA